MKTEQHTYTYSSVKKKTVGLQTGHIHRGKEMEESSKPLHTGCRQFLEARELNDICWGRHKMSAFPQPPPQNLQVHMEPLPRFPYWHSPPESQQHCTPPRLRVTLKMPPTAKTAGGTSIPRAREEDLELLTARCSSRVSRPWLARDNRLQQNVILQHYIRTDFKLNNNEDTIYPNLKLEGCN